MSNKNKHTVIIGAGFTGLSAALTLAERGQSVTLVEQDGEVGGLAGTFEVSGTRLEKFYHHWFSNDAYIMQLAHSLNLQHNVILKPTNTGMYYANQIFRLSRPFDLLTFTPLRLLDRVRLGLLVFKIRQVKDWKALESLTVEEWLIKLCGRRVYEVVWQPLLTGKFGPFAQKISAVWFWKKLALRGGSRNKAGSENLAYYKGGFGAFADAIAERIEKKGGIIQKNTSVKEIKVDAKNKVTGVLTDKGEVLGDVVISTTALPITANISEKYLPEEYIKKLRRVNYLANKCLVLELTHSLSDTYWLNVNDPNFPYVGIIEHTNFESPASYGGSHIVYLSKYLLASDPFYTQSTEETLNFSLPYIKRMFPKFEEGWIKKYHVWTADYAQPIVEKHYSQMIPDYETPVKNFFIASMAQVYPEDRGTNYAIREGKLIANKILNFCVKENGY